jgi:hypothetical protein
MQRNIKQRVNIMKYRNRQRQFNALCDAFRVRVALMTMQQRNAIYDRASTIEQHKRAIALSRMYRVECSQYIP